MGQRESGILRGSQRPLTRDTSLCIFTILSTEKGQEQRLDDALRGLHSPSSHHAPCRVVTKSKDIPGQQRAPIELPLRSAHSLQGQNSRSLTSHTPIEIPGRNIQNVNVDAFAQAAKQILFYYWASPGSSPIRRLCLIFHPCT